MGIDIYARWTGMTDEDEAAQAHALFSANHGHVGYLREAYHGGPYATGVLVPEAFETEDENGAPIPAAAMRSRLAMVLPLVELREKALYKSKRAEIRAAQKSFTDFVELCEKHEAKTGEACRIIASF
jgi:hypothetical protein